VGYALIDSKVELENSIGSSTAFIAPHHKIIENSVLVNDKCLNGFGEFSGVLIVYHNGIKDYKLMFPHIENSSLTSRLGKFAEEADNAFSTQSWISYEMMVGGVLEGLLYNEYGNEKFERLIQLAEENRLIDAREVDLITSVRTARNKIHASKHSQPIIDRAEALELSTAYDRLLKRDWNSKI
jgi:hypothetical protein